MKKLLLTLSFALFLVATMTAGVVNINWATDSLQNNPCNLPQNIMFILGGTTSGYTSGTDSLDINISFGDGQDTTYKINARNNFGTHIYHTYTLPGLYTVRYIVTAPDAASDTVIVPNEIILGSSCGNISGRLYLDNNADCNYDPQDMPIYGKVVKLKLSGQVVYQTYTDTAGMYEFNAVSGLTYEVETSNLSVTAVCPSGGVHTVNSLPAHNLDFAMECQTSQFDLEGRFTGGFIVPGVTVPAYFRVENKLCKPVSGVAKLTLAPEVTYVPSPYPFYTVPDSIVGSTLYFSFNNLGLFSRKGIYIHLKGDTTLTVMDTVCLGFEVTPTLGDANPANNTHNPCIRVRTSYDPNMKTVFPAGVGATGDVKPDQNMLYTIHFQNTGNFMATNIFILDTIDDQTLDVSTLEIVDYSHPMELRVIDNNLLKFSFNNIMLPDSNSNEPESHGFVSFNIAQKPALAEGTKIENTAGIYFDYNPAVITNTALNTINRSIGIEEFGGGAQLNLFDAFPNPASEAITIELVAGVHKATLHLFDLNGKKLMELKVDDRATVNVSQFPQGVYILSAETEAGSHQKRVVIQ